MQLPVRLLLDVNVESITVGSFRTDGIGAAMGGRTPHRRPRPPAPSRAREPRNAKDNTARSAETRFVKSFG